MPSSLNNTGTEPQIPWDPRKVTMAEFRAHAFFAVPEHRFSSSDSPLPLAMTEEALTSSAANIRSSGAKPRSFFGQFRSLARQKLLSLAEHLTLASHQAHPLRWHPQEADQPTSEWLFGDAEEAQKLLDEDGPMIQWMQGWIPDTPVSVHYLPTHIEDNGHQAKTVRVTDRMHDWQTPNQNAEQPMDHHGIALYFNPGPPVSIKMPPEMDGLMEQYGVTERSARRYALAHELAHLTLQNHTPRFSPSSGRISEEERLMWEHVACPDKVFLHEDQSVLRRRWEEAFADVFALEVVKRFCSPEEAINIAKAARDYRLLRKSLGEDRLAQEGQTHPTTPQAAAFLAESLEYAEFHIPYHITDRAIERWIRAETATPGSIAIHPFHRAEQAASDGMLDDWEALVSQRDNRLSLMGASLCVDTAPTLEKRSLLSFEPGRIFYHIENMKRKWKLSRHPELQALSMQVDEGGMKAAAEAISSSLEKARRQIFQATIDLRHAQVLAPERHERVKEYCTRLGLNEEEMIAERQARFKSMAGSVIQGSVEENGPKSPARLHKSTT